MTDATADLLAALRLAADPQAHAKLTTAIEEHRKAKADADAALSDLNNRSYQLDKQRDQLHQDQKIHTQRVSVFEASKAKHDAEVHDFKNQMMQFKRDRADLDESMRGLLARENGLRNRDEWLANAKAEFERSKAAFDMKVAEVKNLLG